jgi:hypothetical protein
VRPRILRIRYQPVDRPALDLVRGPRSLARGRPRAHTRPQMGGIWLAVPGNEFRRTALEFKGSNARRTGMLRSERRDLVTDIEDRLIELYVQQDEARRREDRDQARGFQVEIDKAAAQREEIRRRP